MQMRRPSLVVFVILAGACVGLPARGALGQEPPPADDASLAAPSKDAAPPGESAQAAPPAVDALPPPAADVMRPTRNGFHLTPGIMRLGARQWLREGPFADVEFDADQEKELSQRFSRQVMGLADKHGEQARDFLESFIECSILRDKSMTPEMKQRFGQMGSELVPAMRDLVRDFARDARPLLTDEQWETFKSDLRQEFRSIDRAARSLKRWSEGGARDGEGLRDLDLEGTAGSDDEVASGSGERPRSTKNLHTARRRADAEIRDLGANTWREFLASAKSFFKFDAAQSAKGEELLAEYRHRAEPIMTPQWRQRVRDNRVKYNLRGTLKTELRPWLFHLESEYNELAAPVVEIGNEFREKVIALARPDQREAAIAEVRVRAADHGLVFGELDESLLKLQLQE